MRATTWLSLTSTDLTAREVIVSKMIGAVLGRFEVLHWRGSALVLLGAATDALHPFGVLAVALSVAVFCWFARRWGSGSRSSCGRRGAPSS